MSCTGTVASLLHDLQLREHEALRVSGRRRYLGMDSEFCVLTKSLPPRDVRETLTVCLLRVASGRYEEVRRLHPKYRFDPAGISREERDRLWKLCRAQAASAA
jgi:hypothetical protein